MNITSVKVTDYSKNNNYKPSFGAIHPCLYFEKVGEDSFRLITDNDLIKNTLQKNIVTWLNRNYNARLKVAQCSPVKSKPETPETQAIRERITRFFRNRDNDYKQPNQDRVSSYYYTDSKGVLKPYIFTGKSVDILDVQANKIKQIHSDVNRLAEDLQMFYGFKYSEAKEKAAKELEQNLSDAKVAYHNSVLNILRSPEAKADPANTVFSAVFEPIIRGKKTTYKLIDADFEPRLV
ncbi:MAG: hypothetical protein E7Z87_02790 [Cyanobacteria bacterium SIG26]|nr:hypothetical protein [Cyanobacteria bacterium SIG26]